MYMRKAVIGSHQVGELVDLLPKQVIGRAVTGHFSPLKIFHSVRIVLATSLGSLV